MRTLISALAVLCLTGGLLFVSTDVVNAHFVPVPCDFITGGGWVINNFNNKANFGAHGGCKNGQFWGHVNYVSREGSNPPFHVRSTSITGYLIDPAFPNARDICGTAVTNTDENVTFRVRMEDNGEPGGNDRFGIRLSNGYHLSTRELGPSGGPAGGGGNIKLHKPNPSTTPPVPAPTEFQMCGDLTPP